MRTKPDVHLLRHRKHKGLKMAEVPRDYLEWLSGTDLDEDLAYTVRHYLGRPTPDMEYDTGI